MNRHTVKGTMDEAVGSAKEMAGDLIGNTSLKVKGIAQQAKGKIENALGKVENAVDEASVQPNPPQDPRP
jgi:uncharacterized protein YjbJ (UPF0337 family)